MSRSCLVWLRGLRGPTAEIWSAEYRDLYMSRSKNAVIYVRELCDEETLASLNELARKYVPDLSHD